MAYAAAEFGHSCLKALSGDPKVIECAYVDSHLTELPFFASQVRLGPEGVQVTIRTLSRIHKNFLSLRSISLPRICQHSIA